MSEQIPSVANEIILRDILAIDRTRLANQRTLLSYIRTGLYFIATAVGIAFLRKNDVLFGWKEWALTFIGTLSIVFGVINYFMMRRKIRRAYK
jgi:putative membrane protein